MSNNKLYEITLDETQLIHLTNALKHHAGALCAEYFDNDVPELTEELKLVHDIYNVLREVLEPPIRPSVAMSEEHSMIQVKEIDLDLWSECNMSNQVTNRLSEEERMKELNKSVEEAKRALSTFSNNVIPPPPAPPPHRKNTNWFW